MLLQADKSTTYTKTQVDNSLASKEIKSVFGEVPATNTSILFDYIDNKFRAIHVNSPLSIQAANDAYLTIDANCYTETEVDNSLALKQNVVNNAPGTGERLLEINFLKRIFAVTPLHVNTYLNLNRPHDPKKC